MGRADSALVMLNGLKNIAGFGITYAIVSWNAGGYAISFGTLAAILAASHLPLLLLYYKGEAIRAWTAKKFESGRIVDHGTTF